MKNITDAVDLEIQKIKDALQNQRISNTNRAIAMYLLSAWKNNLQLPKMQELAKILYISLSGISKFIKKFDLVGYPVLTFIFSINASEKNDK